MKSKLLILLAALMLLACTASAATLPAELQAVEEGAFDGDTSLKGVVTLPDGVLAVGSRAFAATGVHALILPEGCATLEADVLSGGQAAYVTLNGSETTVNGSALTDVAFVFGPAEGSASALSGFYALETLVEADGFYYSVTEGEAIPLCAVDGTAISGAVTLPKFVDGQPILSLATLTLTGCEGLTGLSVPSYLTIPSGMTASVYDAMTVEAPVANVTEAQVGAAVTWTTSVTGAYGDVAYIWTFDIDGVVSSVITAQPTVTWTPATEGVCVTTVTAVDALDDTVSAADEGLTVGPTTPIYRAVLVGNVYSSEDNALEGCDTDVAAMRTVLASMTGTPYTVSSYIDANATQIKAAISSAFADARVCDVSLFYFSGHGTSSGSLVGTGSSVISVDTLRALLDTIPGTKIVMIDACYSGNMIGKSTDSTSPSAFTSAFISGFSSFIKDNLATNGYIVLTACSKDQFSQTLSDGTISFGAFTYGLTYGSGYDEWNQTSLGTLPADADSNGAITLGEGYTGATDRIAWLNTMIELDQSVQYYGDTSFVLWSK